MPEHAEPAGESWPVVVVGAGVAGCAAAITLARRGVRTLLLETQAQPGFQIGEGLPAAAGPLLRDLGLWPSFEAAGHLPSWGTVSRWGAAEPFIKDSIMDRNGHGWQLDRVRFNEDMRSAAAAAGAVLRICAGVESITPRPSGGWMLSAGESPIQAAWLIDATGRRSTVARLLGARRQSEDTLVSRFTAFSPGAGSSDRDSRTHIEAVPDGWWYSVLTPSGRRVVAYLTDADLLPEGDLQTALNETSGITELVSSYAACEWHTTSAQSARLHPIAGERWIAVGDAALSFDPLSSQGMLTALYTGLRGGEAVVACLTGDSQPMVAFRSRLETIWETYMSNRTAYYHMERRWSDRPFWQRRHSDNGQA